MEQQPNSEYFYSNPAMNKNYNNYFNNQMEIPTNNSSPNFNEISNPNMNSIGLQNLFQNNFLESSIQPTDNLPSNYTKELEKRRITSNFIDINSSSRQILPSITTDMKITLEKDPIILSNNSALAFVKQKNHNFVVGDSITLSNVFNKVVTLRTYNGPNSPAIEIFPGTNIMKINYKSQIPLTINQNENNLSNTEISISGLVGDFGLNQTYLGNIPVNIINGKHIVKFALNKSDVKGVNKDSILNNPMFFTTSSEYFFIVLPLPMNNKNPPYVLEDYNFKLFFESIAGISLNDLNTGNSNYHQIVNVESDGYFIELPKKIFIQEQSIRVGGSNVNVSKIVETIPGYPFPNNYSINLRNVYNNIISARLLSTEIPNTEKLIKESPENRRNNRLYWNNIDDGDYIYMLSIPEGNYTINDLKKELEKQFNSTPLTPSIPRILSNNSRLDPNHNVIVDINPSTNEVIFKPYKKFNLVNPIVKIEPSTLIENSDPNTNFSLTINHPNHGIDTIGTIITIKNAISTLGIPSDIINKEHTITEIIDKDNYKITLDKFNFIDENKDTKGGVNVNVYIPDKIKLRFDKKDTLGTILGFNNVGEETSITDFKEIISNKDPYYDQISYVGPNNSLKLKPFNYILMEVDPLTSMSSTTSIPNSFAKILLSSNDRILFNTFVPLTYFYNDPIGSINTLKITFYNPDGTLYDFDGQDHSFTLELITINDIPQ